MFLDCIYPPVQLDSPAPGNPCAFAPKYVKCAMLERFPIKGGNYGNRTA